MNKADRDYLDAVIRDGCVLCEFLGFGQSPAEVHHQRTGTGAARRASHRQVVALCPRHHRIGPVAFHVMGRKAFERLHGITELALVEMTARRVNGG